MFNLTKDKHNDPIQKTIIEQNNQLNFNDMKSFRDEIIKQLKTQLKVLDDNMKLYEAYQKEVEKLQTLLKVLEDKPASKSSRENSKLLNDKITKLLTEKHEMAISDIVDAVQGNSSRDSIYQSVWKVLKKSEKFLSPRKGFWSLKK